MIRSSRGPPLVLPAAKRCRKPAAVAATISAGPRRWSGCEPSRKVNNAHHFPGIPQKLEAGQGRPRSSMTCKQRDRSSIGTSTSRAMTGRPSIIGSSSRKVVLACNMKSFNVLLAVSQSIEGHIFVSQIYRTWPCCSCPSDVTLASSVFMSAFAQHSALGTRSHRGFLESAEIAKRKAITTGVRLGFGSCFVRKASMRWVSCN